MMKSILLDFGIDFPNDPEIRKNSERFLVALLGFNCFLNHRYLQAHPNTPRLYDSGVTYAPPDQAPSAHRPSPAALKQIAAILKREGSEAHRIQSVLRVLNGVEEFLDVPALYARRKGDCNELVPVRVAELWQAGIDASPHLVKEPGASYHAVVLWPDGSDEDPSRILGMGDQEGRGEEIRKNAERWATHMATGSWLAAEEDIPIEVLGKQMDLLGLLPRDGIFRVGGPMVDLLGSLRRPRKTAAGSGLAWRDPWMRSL